MIRLASKLKKEGAGEDGRDPGDGSRRISFTPVKTFLIRDRLLIKGLLVFRFQPKHPTLTLNRLTFFERNRNTGHVR
jgi:hypothetical protein